MSRLEARASQSKCKLFRFPEVGSYLDEVMDGKRTSLINEGFDYQDPISNEVPVRFLKDFTFFDPRTLALVSLSCLSEEQGFCEAFGHALAECNEEDQDDRDFIQDDNGISLHLSNILKCSLDIHQKNIWVLTEYAWYILQMPSPEYRQIFTTFYTKEIILRVVLRNIVQNPAITPQQFFHSISLPLAEDYFMGRCWTKEDIQSNFKYSSRELQNILFDFPDVSWEGIRHAPLLRKLLQAEDPTSIVKARRSLSNRGTSKVRFAVPAVPRRIQTSPTAVTPTVHSLISSFFDIEFNIVGEKPGFLDEAILSRGKPRDQEITKMSRLKPGDFVLVNEGDYREESNNRYAQIIYLKRGGKTFHVRWFIPGSQTLLEELAFEQELFLSIADECRDISVDCVVGKCKVDHISLQDRSNLQWPAEDTYFFSSSWDRNNPADFSEIKKEDDVSSLCTTCDSGKSESTYWVSSSCGIIKNRKYHKDDFIYYRATNKEQLTCSFGQIITFNTSENGRLEVQIKVRRLGRMSDRSEQGFCVENELFVTQMQEVVNHSMVLGMCQVAHISQLKDHLTKGDWLDRDPLKFYVHYQAESLKSPLTELPSDALRACDACQKTQKATEELERKFSEQRPIRAFDPFAGVGGFGLGLARGCSMLTTHGVELNPSAAETMRRNFPKETKILNDDASRVLEHVFQGRAGVPQRGEVDLLYSGPPCQNDSTLNMHKTDRKCLAFTALSYLDMLRPHFFVMESVPGFLQWEVQGTTRKIKAGDLKLVLKVLHFLGYNVKGRLLHARSFGDPQTRSRFFIVATLPECGDFSFPEATHAFKPGQSGGITASLGHLKVKAAVSRVGCGLQEVVTAYEAISDLPPFDWAIPGRNGEADTSRSRDITAVPFDADGIQDSEFQYISPPQNIFQHRARRELGLSDPQYQHCTKILKVNAAKNVCDIPLIKKADYRHLDQKNREWAFRDPASAKAIRGYQAGGYTRLDADGYFQTIVTNVGPTAKQSAVLHPTCKRILTVRELARAQGFPDEFVFYSETDKIDDYHKQIGNSVPFGTSAALGRSIQELLFKQWMIKRDGSPSS